MNFCCNMTLIPKLAAVGAVIASLIGECAIVLVQAIFVKECIDLIEFFKQSKNYIIASSMMLILLPIVNKLDSNILNIIIIGGAGCCIYGISLLILKDEMCESIFNKLKCKLNYKRKGAER